MRDALVVPLHEKVCAVLAIPENADALQGSGYCGAQFLSCVVNEIKGRSWFGLQGLTRSVWSLVALVLHGGCQGRSCKGGWRRLSSPLFSLWRGSARGLGLCGCCSWLELSCARCCWTRVEGCGAVSKGAKGVSSLWGLMKSACKLAIIFSLPWSICAMSSASSACLSANFARDLALATESNIAWIKDPEWLSGGSKRIGSKNLHSNSKGDSS